MSTAETAEAAGNNHELYAFYTQLAETVRQLPEGLPKLLDRVFTDKPSRRGHISSDSHGNGIGIGRALDLLNSSVGDELVLDLAKFIGLEDLRRQRFWDNYSEATDDGSGHIYMGWSTSYSRRIENFLTFNLPSTELTAYQAMLEDYAELAITEPELAAVAQAKAAGEPEWLAAAIEYVGLKVEQGVYPESAAAQFGAFFYGNAPDQRFSPHEATYIARYGSYEAAAKAPL